MNSEVSLAEKTVAAIGVILSSHGTEKYKGVPFNSAAESFHRIDTLLDVVNSEIVAQALAEKWRQGYDIRDFCQDISGYTWGYALNRQIKLD